MRDFLPTKITSREGKLPNAYGIGSRKSLKETQRFIDMEYIFAKEITLEVTQS